MDEFYPGDRIRISYKERRKLIKKEVTVVNTSNKRFIVVNNGAYNSTIDFFELDKGKVKIELIARKGGGISEVFNAPYTVQNRQNIQNVI